VAVEQNRQAYSSGGCVGMAENEILRVTDFPFNPPMENRQAPLKRREFSRLAKKRQV